MPAHPASRLRFLHSVPEDGKQAMTAIRPHPFKLDEQAQEAALRMRAIQAEFAANGLVAHLTDARAGLDLTAVPSHSGTRETEVLVDETGYIEVRYWSPPGATAAQISAAALRALHALADLPPGQVSPGHGSGSAAP